MSDEQVYDEGESYVEDDVDISDYDPESLEKLQGAIDHINELPDDGDQMVESVALIEALGGEAV